MSLTGKKSLLILVNLFITASILFHSYGGFLLRDLPKKSLLVPLCLFSFLFFGNTLFYAQQQLYDNQPLAAFQKKLMIILFPACLITVIIIFFI